MSGLTYEDVALRLSYDPSTGRFERVGPYKGKGLYVRETYKGYLKIQIMGERIFAHRLAWLLHHKRWPEEMIDHVNGDRSDNRIENLRSASAHQNAANSKIYSSNTTGFKGVSERRPGEFRARIQVNGKSLSLGTFPTPEKAHEAYEAAANQNFGEFARTA